MLWRTFLERKSLGTSLIFSLVPGGWIPIPEDIYFLMYIARLFSWEVAWVYIPTSSMTVSSTLNISDKITSV